MRGRPTRPPLGCSRITSCQKVRGAVERGAVFRTHAFEYCFSVRLISRREGRRGLSRAGCPCSPRKASDFPVSAIMPRVDSKQRCARLNKTDRKSSLDLNSFRLSLRHAHIQQLGFIEAMLRRVPSSWSYPDSQSPCTRLAFISSS